VQKQKKSTMGIKHASACAWNFFFLSFFLSSLFFYFEQVATKNK
jgi:hypothetical protein